jgi:hypothetical protein
MAKVINRRTDRSEHDRPEQSMVAPSEPETWQREPHENDYDPGPDRVVQGKRDAKRAEPGHRQQSDRRVAAAEHLGAPPRDGVARGSA